MSTLLDCLDPSDSDFEQRVAALAGRALAPDAEVAVTVARIIADVRERGDEAVRAYAERFDGLSVAASFEIDVERWRRAAERVHPDVAAALRTAAERIRDFHRHGLPGSYQTEGGTLALRASPLARVGLYVPGGTARYPSSVLMTAVPAAVAGVDEIIMVTPGASDETLAAAQIAGVHRVFELGGAHAVAALALGTETVPRVDKIVGPGNQWVAEAKRQVYGLVDIDAVAGPSEILIIADGSARPAIIAADLLAQAEHDTEARCLLITTESTIIAPVETELARQLADLPRAEIARTALSRYGAAIVARDRSQAIAIANQYAPEHLELLVGDPDSYVDELRCAGAIFVGEYSPEAAGDYLAGPNHVLPTAGTARYASPLGVYDYCKYTSILRWGRDQLRAAVDDIDRLAAVEGLDAHGRSARIRFGDPGDE